MHAGVARRSSTSSPRRSRRCTARTNPTTARRSTSVSHSPSRCCWSASTATAAAEAMVPPEATASRSTAASASTTSTLCWPIAVAAWLPTAVTTATAKRHAAARLVRRRRWQWPTAKRRRWHWPRPPRAPTPPWRRPPKLPQSWRASERWRKSATPSRHSSSACVRCSTRSAWRTPSARRCVRAPRTSYSHTITTTTRNPPSVTASGGHVPTAAAAGTPLAEDRHAAAEQRDQQRRRATR
mmetsp:Transcript_9706/g.23149  ORF Transcript_9706/g.23149 Transcript_9706/m.23149 type:complete len:240 (-) Transcript_9706:283-1002(-)